MIIYIANFCSIALNIQKEQQIEVGKSNFLHTAR